MRRQEHEQGQTGIAILARLVALVALGVAISLPTCTRYRVTVYKPSATR